MSKESEKGGEEVSKDPRFRIAEFDPRFLPIDARASASDPRLQVEKRFSTTSKKQKKRVPVSIPFEEVYDFGEKKLEDGESDKLESQQTSGDSPDNEINGNDQSSTEDLLVPPPPPENDDEWLQSYLTPNEFKFLKKNMEQEEESSFHAYKELLNKHPSYKGVTPWDIVEASHVAEEEAVQKTSRFAVTNHDFEVVSLKDLFAIFSAFCPKGGKVVRGFRYYTRFGEQAITKDLESVPRNIEVDEDLLDDEDDDDDDDEDEEEENDDDKEETKEQKDKNVKKDGSGDDDEGEKDIGTVLEERRSVTYQMQKLRYFFAVFEFDSPDTCIKVYDLCNGYDVEDTQQYLDLSIIPREKSFEDYILVEGPVGSKDMKDYTHLHKGKSKVFNTPKSMNSIWDVDSSERKRVLDPKNFEEVPESEILKYLNCDDDDEEEEDIENIRNLLLGGRIGEGEDEEEEVEEEEVEVEEEEEEVEGEGEEGEDESKIIPPPPASKSKGEDVLQNLVYKGSEMEEGREFNIKADRQREHQLKRAEKGEKETSASVDLDRFPQLMNNPDFQLDPSHHKYSRAKSYSKVISKKRSRKRMEEEGLMIDEDGEIKELESPTKKRKIDDTSGEKETVE